MKDIKNVARVVSERLSYHFASTSGDWNVPEDMPFMREFFNEIRTLCDFCLRASELTLPQKPKVSEVLDTFNELLNDWWAYQDYEARQSITSLTSEGFASLDEHDRAMNACWHSLSVEEKITLWRRL